MATLVELVPYDRAWPRIFSDIADELVALIGASAVRIDHIGSTAVPGLPAKPMIDIDVTLRSVDDIPAASAALVASGYQARGNRYDDGVWAFQWLGETLSRRLYLCAPANLTHIRRLIFRDHLRRHQDAAAAYASLKADLARQFPYDGDAYTAGKSGFINAIVERASGLEV